MARPIARCARRHCFMAPASHSHWLPFFWGVVRGSLTKFDPEQTLKTLADYAATNVFMVPTHFQGMFSLPPQTLARYPTPDLKTIISNAAALPQDRQGTDRRAFRGRPVIRMFTAPRKRGSWSNLHPADQLRKTQCVGQPFPCTEIQILDNTGQPVSANTIGEVCSRSPYFIQRLLGSTGCDRGDHCAASGFAPVIWVAWTRTATCIWRAAPKT